MDRAEKLAEEIETHVDAERIAAALKSRGSSWRAHDNHREEAQAVKRALKEAGIPVKSVGHGRGTAWAWLEINLGENPSGLEHIKQEAIPWLCVGGCPACERNRELRDQTIRIAQAVTGRRGDYNGEINVLMQIAENLGN